MAESSYQGSHLIIYDKSTHTFAAIEESKVLKLPGGGAKEIKAEQKLSEFDGTIKYTLEKPYQTFMREMAEKLKYIDQLTNQIWTSGRTIRVNKLYRGKHNLLAISANIIDPTVPFQVIKSLQFVDSHCVIYSKAEFLKKFPNLEKDYRWVSMDQLVNYHQSIAHIAKDFI